MNNTVRAIAGTVLHTEIGTRTGPKPMGIGVDWV